ncbi:hypothetical protein [Tomitella biformata]|uniref:hypothetical protein n=1 Tax=Tomitella biformata TaxID=630403 RepID=UPI0004673770|nr:hypothetical protein [Tomitella biformata]
MGTHVGTKDLDLLLAAAQDLLGNPVEWTRPDRFHDSLALAVIDAIQSTAAEYGKSVRAVDRYRAYRSAQGQADVVDGTRALLRTFEEVGGALTWSGKIGNYKRSYSDSLSLRANAIQEAAESLHALRIDSAADLRAVVTDPTRYQAARDAWMSASAATDEINWTYLLMLVGVSWVQPQSLSSRFVIETLGEDPGIDAVRGLLSAVADGIAVSLVELEHAIWRWELNLAEPAEIPALRPAILAAA